MNYWFQSHLWLFFDIVSLVFLNNSKGVYYIGVEDENFVAQ
jgi:hypothetical protein